MANRTRAKPKFMNFGRGRLDPKYIKVCQAFKQAQIYLQKINLNSKASLFGLARLNSARLETSSSNGAASSLCFVYNNRHVVATPQIQGRQDLAKMSWRVTPPAQLAQLWADWPLIFSPLSTYHGLPR